MLFQRENHLSNLYVMQTCDRNTGRLSTVVLSLFVHVWLCSSSSFVFIFFFFSFILLLDSSVWDTFFSGRTVRLSHQYTFDANVSTPVNVIYVLSICFNILRFAYVAFDKLFFLIFWFKKTYIRGGRFKFDYIEDEIRAS